MSQDKASRPRKDPGRISKKEKKQKHASLMDVGLRAEIKFNATMAERRMQQAEEKAKEMNERFNAQKLAEKMKEQDEESRKSMHSLGDGLLMVSGLEPEEGTRVAGGETGDGDVQTELESDKKRESKRKRKEEKKAAKRETQINTQPKVEPLDVASEPDSSSKRERKSKKRKHADEGNDASVSAKSTKKSKRHQSHSPTDEVQPQVVETSDARLKEVSTMAGQGDRIGPNKDNDKKSKKHKDKAQDIKTSAEATTDPTEHDEADRHTAAQHVDSTPASTTGQKKKHTSKKKTAKHDGEAPQPDENSATDLTTDDKPSKPRFITFLGNLPYTATTESIAKHFTRNPPTAIRLPTHRDNDDKTTSITYEKRGGRTKGFAFLEWEDYDRMKTALKLYHHSVFDDGVSEARKVNVELTAGGGGGGKGRKEKIKGKNTKLEVERMREKKRKREEKEERRQGREKAKGDKITMDRARTGMGDVHPSRFSRINT